MNQSHSIITDHIQSYRDGGISAQKDGTSLCFRLSAQLRRFYKRELGYYFAYRPVLFAANIIVNEYTDK